MQHNPQAVCKAAIDLNLDLGKLVLKSGSIERLVELYLAFATLRSCLEI